MSLEMRINWNGRAAQAVTAAGVRGLNQAAAYLQSRVIPRTPKDTGELRRSLVIQPASVESPTATLSSNLPYAVRQHEELGYRHKYGEAKFLERPFYEEAETLQRIIANNINRGS